MGSEFIKKHSHLQEAKEAAGKEGSSRAALIRAVRSRRHEKGIQNSKKGQEKRKRSSFEECASCACSKWLEKLLIQRDEIHHATCFPNMYTATPHHGALHRTY
jgi:hypothetical protein